MPKKHKSVIGSWGYNKQGLYLDCYVDIGSIFDANYIKMIELRSRFQGPDCNYGLFRVPINWGREELELAIKACSEKQLQEAHKAILSSTYTLRSTDTKDKFIEHMNDLPLLMGVRPWLDSKIKEALS